MSKVIEMWLEKLNSGKIEQCPFQLKKGKCRCVMGVLCDVLIELIPERFEWRGNLFYDKTEDDYARKVIPMDAQLAAGLDDDLVKAIVEANDDGKLFKTLARIIGEHYVAV